MRKIAWTGTTSQYVKAADGSAVLDEHHENRRDIPFWYNDRPGSIRIIGPESGLSKEYRFGAGSGPESFIQEMEDDDATTLLNIPGVGQNFRDVTDDPGFFGRFYRPVSEISHANG